MVWTWLVFMGQPEAWDFQTHMQTGRDAHTHSHTPYLKMCKLLLFKYDHVTMHWDDKSVHLISVILFKVPNSKRNRNLAKRWLTSMDTEVTLFLQWTLCQHSPNPDKESVHTLNIPYRHQPPSLLPSPCQAKIRTALIDSSRWCSSCSRWGTWNFINRFCSFFTDLLWNGCVLVAFTVS